MQGATGAAQQAWAQPGHGRRPQVLVWQPLARVCCGWTGPVACVEAAGRALAAWSGGPDWPRGEAVGRPARRWVARSAGRAARSVSPIERSGDDRAVAMVATQGAARVARRDPWAATGRQVRLRLTTPAVWPPRGTGDWVAAQPVSWPAGSRASRGGAAARSGRAAAGPRQEAVPAREQALVQPGLAWR